MQSTASRAGQDLQRLMSCFMSACFFCADPWPLVTAMVRSALYKPATVSATGFTSIDCDPRTQQLRWAYCCNHGNLLPACISASHSTGLNHCIHSLQDGS